MEDLERDGLNIGVNFEQVIRAFHEVVQGANLQRRDFEGRWLHRQLSTHHSKLLGHIFFRLLDQMERIPQNTASSCPRTNSSSFAVWVAGIGPPTYHADPAITGFQLLPKQFKVISLPSTLESVRFWPRTGCRYVQDTISQNGVNVNITKFRCDTGDCGSILNMYGMECQMVSGLPPATLAEFSLSTKGNDFYDLSNVDGYNVGMKIEPYNFEKANIEDPNFDCGAPGCVMDTSKCPEELKFKDHVGVIHCLSICQAIYNEKQRARHPRLQELWDMQTDRGFMRDNLCCTCGTGGGLCESIGSPCTYGCSPFVDSYTDAAYKTRKCENIPGTYLPQWPKASNGENYASVFNKQCPEAYSWQFNDDQSTYQCRLADYKVQFHSHRSTL
eukprot:GGOE01056752.1.p1 GENE.GGOE01056752.1~~GGOE01056752.1.p1  ORF type:complete len:387 (-),score=91.05 GGOE01056752.1:12-1172(-)